MKIVNEIRNRVAKTKTIGPGRQLVTAKTRHQNNGGSRELHLPLHPDDQGIGFQHFPGDAPPPCYGGERVCWGRGPREIRIKDPSPL